MTWKGESRRHSLSRKGIKTTQAKGISRDPSTNLKISSIIQNQIKEYESSPCEINSGECEEFAWELARKIPNAKVSESNWDVIFTNPNGKKEWIPTHFWITIGNLHYDAETPEGVDDYHKLPIFIRAGVPNNIDFLINWGND
ncbi:hypothetical protein KAU43_05840 [candidate division WOR-3 bacterium]|nr:hypothetical protein [candidate division WOR-3 bacterium]